MLKEEGQVESFHQVQVQESVFALFPLF